MNKADGENIHRAERAALEYRAGLYIFAAGNPTVAGGADGFGAGKHRSRRVVAQGRGATSGACVIRRARQRRSDQAAAWMRELFEQRPLAAFRGSGRAARHWSEMEARSGPAKPPRRRRRRNSPVSPRSGRGSRLAVSGEFPFLTGAPLVSRAMVQRRLSSPALVPFRGRRETRPPGSRRSPPQRSRGDEKSRWTPRRCPPNGPRSPRARRACSRR